MNQETKNAMLEFIEPGSSIPLEKLIEEFAIMCNETKRGSFHITRNVRTRKWRVHLSCVRKSFVGTSLRKCITDAGQFVFENRTKTETEFML